MTFSKNYAHNYDFLYQDKDYEKECDYLESLFAKFSIKPKTILDLGCGTGGHALILSYRGYHVTGVDLSQSMLDIAKKKAVMAKGKIEFIQADITKIDLAKKFDVVISMFAVMGYQTSNHAFAQACKTVWQHLHPGGVFFFDCWNGFAVCKEKPVSRMKEVIVDKQNKIIRFSESDTDFLNHTVQVNFKVWEVNNGIIKKETQESHVMRFLFPAELKYYLEIAGFDGADCFPFLECGRDVGCDDWNIMAVARKNL